MNKYKKRQLTAAAVLLLLIVLIFMMVKCAASGAERKNSSTENSESAGTEYTETDTDSSAADTPLSNVRPEVHEFIPADMLSYADCSFSPEDISLVNEKYMNDIVVVGDSISKGYSVYGRIKEDNVLAVGSIGVRNVLETDFEYQGYNLKITDILSRKKPKYIFISLGMNDVNLRTPEQYIEDYKHFISEIRSVTSDSYIIVTAVTPVSRQTTFTQNEKIDAYNEALRKMTYDLNSEKVYYVNAAQNLKGSDNYLVAEFSSGDGIHLAAGAYDYLLTYMLSLLEWI